MGVLAKKVKIFLIVFFTISAFKVEAISPIQPILPSDNIQDPGSLSTPWGGCTPSDTNCYVAVNFFNDETVEGLDYSTSTGILSLTSGYTIPTTASTTAWNSTLYSLSSSILVQNGNSFGTTLTLGTNDNNGLSLETNNIQRLNIDNSGNVNITGALTLGTALADGQFIKSGDWSGLFDGQEGSYYLDRANQTGTQLALTISDFATSTKNLLSSSITGLSYSTTTGAFSLTSGYEIPLTASTTEWSNKVSSQWVSSGSDIYYMTGNVGIGTSTPTALLHTYSSGSATVGLKVENRNSSVDSFRTAYQTDGDYQFAITKEGFLRTIISSAGVTGSEDGMMHVSGSVPLNHVRPSALTLRASYYGDGTGGSSARYGVDGVVYIQSGTQSVVANNWDVRIYNTAPTSYGSYGPYNPVLNGATFLVRTASATGAKTISGEFVGGQFKVQAQSDATFSGANGKFVAGQFYAESQSGSIVPFLAGIRVGNSTAGTVTNAYGIYLDSVSGASTGNYSIYSEGGTMYHGGNVGIGTSTPTEKLSVIGNGQFTAVGSGAYAFDLNLTSTGVLTTSASDERLKENIMTISSTSTLEKISLLRPVTFDWKTNGSHDIGLIAQEVEQIFPELVFTNPTDGYKGVNYSRFISLLISSIQEISSKLNKVLTWFVNDKFNIQGDVCVEDICVTKQQFKQILINSQAGQVQSPAPTPAPAPDTTPAPEPSPTPDPEIPAEETEETVTEEPVAEPEPEVVAEEVTPTEAPAPIEPAPAVEAPVPTPTETATE